VDAVKNIALFFLHTVFSILGILEKIFKSSDMGGEKMANSKKNAFMKNNNALPKADVEFAQDGYEKKALKALKKQNK
jgi:hypothetical protein